MIYEFIRLSGEYINLLARIYYQEQNIPCGKRVGNFDYKSFQIRTEELLQSEK